VDVGSGATIEDINDYLLNYSFKKRIKKHKRADSVRCFSFKRFSQLDDFGLGQWGFFTNWV